MIKDIILKEIRYHTHTDLMIVYFSVILFLMVSNGFVFSINYNRKFQNFIEVRNENLKNIRNASENLLDLVFLPQKIIKPPSILSFISEGQQKNLPNGLELTFFSESNPCYFKNRNLFFSTFISIDWTNICLFFISFICLCFSYNAFSGEKMKGTLKLMLSNHIPRWRVIIGKFLGILVIILSPVVIGLIVNLLIYQFHSHLLLTYDDYLLVLLYFVGITLFVSLNILLGFYISSCTSRPSISLSIVLVVWIMFNVVIPSTIWLFARRMKPVSSISMINGNIESTFSEIDKSKKFSRQWEGDWEGKPPHELLLRRVAGVTEKTRVYNDMWRTYRNSMFAQTETAIMLSKISPYAVFRFLGESISDNGFHGFNNFYRQVRAYLYTYQSFIKLKDQKDKDSHHLIWNEKWAAKSFMSQKPVSYAEIPKFRYRRPLLTTTLNELKWDVFILILWNLVLFAATFMSFIRYDVR